MKLNSFKATDVHGYLKYDIDFSPELTFLIGINGSGKTSALKLILGLISPSFQYLNQIDYDFAELICSSKENEKDIIITSHQNKEDNTFSLHVRTPKDDVTSVFKRFVRSRMENFDIEDTSIQEQSYNEQFDISETTRIIREFATPKFLGLDRKIYEGKNIDSRFRNRRIYLHQKSGKRFSEANKSLAAIDSSLDDVQFLVFEYFRKIAQEQPKISEEFKRKIFQLAFKFNDDHNIDAVPVDTDQLLDKKEKVLKAIENLDLRFLNNSADIFFDKMANIIISKREVSLNKSNLEEEGALVDKDDFKLLMKWVNNSSQMKRIEDIITFSQTYQEKIAELRSPIKKLENIASNFFKEAKKKIIIADDGEIVVQGKGKIASVFELSSGEKQIIIMIAHLIFEEDQKPSGVFIIDEPELSLHIAWQEIFVNSIIEASPKTQFILATHAPSIISNIEREQFCQDLNKLNY